MSESNQAQGTISMEGQPMGDPHPCDLTMAGCDPITGKPNATVALGKEKERLFTVFGTVTVSCSVKIHAMGAEDAVRLANMGAFEEEWSSDNDGEPHWKEAKEVSRG